MDKGIFEDYERCLQDEPAASTARCPFHVDLPLFCSQVAEGDFEEAFRTLQKRLPLAGLFCLICEHPCESVCVRRAIGEGAGGGCAGEGADAGEDRGDGAVNIHELERAAVSYGWAPLKRKFATSKKNGRVAVVGGGISGLAAAMELDRKGYKVQVFEESSRLGGSVWALAGERLSQEQIERELRQVGELGIEILYYEHVSNTRLLQMQAEYDAVFLGSGSWDAPLAIDPATLQVSGSSLFAGGSLCQDCDTVIAALYSGKKAAISIDRYIKKVSLTAEREREGAFSTLLPYSTAGIDIKPRLTPAVAVYTPQEAQAEAARCLRCCCDECLKACAHIQHYGRRPKTYAREIYTNENVFMGTRYANQMINSCTLCGLCKQRCPIDIGMAELVRYARRSMVESNKMPPSAHDFALRDMEFSNSERFFLLRPAATVAEAAAVAEAAVSAAAAVSTAVSSAADAGLAATAAATAADTGSAAAATAADAGLGKYLFYPGCQLSASSPEHVQQAYRYLDAALGTHPDGGVGLMLGCCGAPADWAGRDDLTLESAERIRLAWSESGNPTFILCCSSCMDVFARYLPEIQTISLWSMICRLGLPGGGGGARAVAGGARAVAGGARAVAGTAAGGADGGHSSQAPHHCQPLQQPSHCEPSPDGAAIHLPDDGTPAAPGADSAGAAAGGATAGQTLSVHDACSARHDATTQQSVRDIAAALGYQIAELKYSGVDTKCCGYGGLVFYANREQEQEFAANRVEESPHDLLVYCAMCKDLFVNQGKRTYHLLDLLFAKDPRDYALRRMPTLSERQANRSALRSQLLAEFWGDDASRQPRRELGFSLLIADEVQQAMEQQMILVEDVEDVLSCAESRPEPAEQPDLEPPAQIAGQARNDTDGRFQNNDGSGGGGSGSGGDGGAGIQQHRHCEPSPDGAAIHLPGGSSGAGGGRLATGGRFQNTEDGSFLASLRKGYVTYWVHYLIEDNLDGNGGESKSEGVALDADTGAGMDAAAATPASPRQIRVLGVYSHRMDIIKG